MPRIFLHIGDRKTGTSSLQSVLDQWDRDGGARAAGLLYPRAGRLSHARINHVNLAHELTRDARFQPELGSWADLAAEVAATDAAHVLISSEGFEYLAPQVLAEAIRTHLGPEADVTILCYYRPHMSRILASYTQNLKRGLHSETLESFVEKNVRGRMGHAFRRLEAMREVFGDRFRLRVYERDRLIAGDIVADVLGGSVGLDAATLKSLPAAVVENRAPKAVTLEILRQLYQRLGLTSVEAANAAPAVLEAAMIPLRQRLDAAAADDRALSLDAAMASLIHRTCLHDARAIDAAFFAEAPCIEAALDKALATALAAPAAPDLDPRERAIHEAYHEVIAVLLRGTLAADRAEAPKPAKLAKAERPLKPANPAKARRAARKRLAAVV